MNREKGNLVRLFDLDEDFIVDLRYAGPDNFTGQQVYTSGECWMDRHTAESLIRAKNIFKEAGYRVKIWDAYRPVSVQARFWEIMPDDNFVARPPDMHTLKTFRATHMNGLCVDVTLTDMDGNEIVMPCEFDDMTERASLACEDTPEEGRRNAAYLKEVMESVGFEGYKGEWWHFYDRGTAPTPYLDFQI